MAIQKADICSGPQQVFYHLCLLGDHCQVQGGLQGTKPGENKQQKSFKPTKAPTVRRRSSSSKLTGMKSSHMRAFFLLLTGFLLTGNKSCLASVSSQTLGGTKLLPALQSQGLTCLFEHCGARDLGNEMIPVPHRHSNPATSCPMAEFMAQREHLCFPEPAQIGLGHSAMS